jgi:hypothetical protein
VSPQKKKENKKKLVTLRKALLPTTTPLGIFDF